MYINIGNRREVLWDDYLVDTAFTTALLTGHKPIKKERVYDFDKYWESKVVNYHNCIKIGDEYYVYYIAGIPCEGKKELIKDFNKEMNILKSVCLMKGPDLMHLERANMGIYEINGSYDNNILLMQRVNDDFEEEFDNFFVFVDTNPNCPEDEKIKAIAQNKNLKKGFPGFRELWSYTSQDGIHFNLCSKISGGDEPFAGLFDSLNTVFYDEKEGLYKAFVRGLHLDYGVAASAMKDGLMTAEMEKSLAKDGIRDIRYMESKDFKTWSVPKLISYTDNEDYPLYTNLIQRYERAPHIHIGIPTRYIERKEWSMNFEQLGGKKNASYRKDRISQNPRYGLAITDSIFMSSRDGKVWNRFHETFVGGEAEHDYNWRYGDGYFMYNIFETPCDAPCEDTELSMLVLENSLDRQRSLRRYTIRKDGFASYHSGYAESVLTTKPFIFEGTELSVNFSTSPAGYMYVELLDENGELIESYRSCELFGNNTDRTVYFGDSKDVSNLSGRPVRLRFVMKCCDIYSFIFRKEEDK